MKKLQFLFFVVVVFVFSVQAGAAVPPVMNYQGRLTGPGGPVTVPVTVTFSFWDAVTAGSSLGPGWSDDDAVTPDAGGVFSTLIGDDPGNPIPAAVFSAPSLWLQVSVNGTALGPRQRVVSSGYAVEAAHAATADTASNVAEGVIDTLAIADGAITDADLATNAGISPSKIAQGHLSGLDADTVDGFHGTDFLTTESDPTVNDLATAGLPCVAGEIVRRTVLGWACSTDQVAVPLELSTASSVGTEATIRGDNTGAGYGVYGWSSSNTGVYGFSASVSGVMGYSNGGTGVEGLNGGNGNAGRLGSPAEGVYGNSSSGIGVKGTSTSGTGGYFSSGSGNGLIVESGRVGIGTTTPTDLLNLNSATGGVFMGIDFATDENSGIKLTEAGTTRWIFPFFRGWQSDNLIIRDEVSLNDVMTFESGTGAVGIGTNSPKQRLHNTGDYYGKGHIWLHAYQGDGADGTAYVQARDDSGTSSIDLLLRSQNAGSPVNAVMIKRDGNVGLGTISPSEKLEVNGNLKVNGHISWPAKNGYLSVPPAAFTPQDGGANYTNVGHRIASSDLFSSQDFYAPVNLPHGAVVTQLVTFWEDDSVNDATLDLMIRPLTNSCAASIWAAMGSVLTTWNASSGVQTRADTTISYATIDDINCTYFLELTLPPIDQDPLEGYGPLHLIGVRIDYTYTEN